MNLCARTEQAPLTVLYACQYTQGTLRNTRDSPGTCQAFLRSDACMAGGVRVIALSSTRWATMSQSHACCKGAHLCFRIRPGHPCALACALTDIPLREPVYRAYHSGTVHAVGARTAPDRARTSRTRTIRSTTSWVFSSVPSRDECRRCHP